MPHRIGYLWEQMITEDNCIKAELLIGKNKPDNRMARYLSDHADKYGKILRTHIMNGYRFSKPYETTITDSYKGKKRNLKIPCLEDQAAMQAWLNIATPFIEKRNYFYNCGSIPGAGQSRAVNGLKRKLCKKNPPKWAAVTDIRKFYDTCPHEVVLEGLRRVFKDERFILFAKKIMDSMSDTGKGLAIGYPVSHWFANVALMQIDLDLRRKYPDVLHFRYMDDVPMISRNKRHLRQALKYYMERVDGLSMSVKSNWQIFPITSRGITFLSYRFFQGYTILAKKLMIRISRRIRAASRHMDLHAAMSVVSYIGILKHCNSHHFYMAHVEPYVNPKKCRRIISHETSSGVRCERHQAVAG